MRIEDYLEKKITLPVDLIVRGKKYRNIILREFGGLDEEEISKPQYRDNLSLIQEIAITRCIAAIVETKVDAAGKEVVVKTITEELPTPRELPTNLDIRKLPVQVIDLLLLELRELTVGPTFTQSIICSNKQCKKRIEPTIELKDFRPEEGVDYSDKDVILDRGILHEGNRLKKAKVKQVSGELRAKLFNKKTDLRDFGANNTELLFKCIIDIDGIEPTVEMVRMMKKIDRIKIFKALGDIKGIMPTQDFVCPFCGEEFKIDVDLIDFLF